METIFLTTKQLGIRWNLKEETLRQWHYLKKGPVPFKIGGRLNYKLKDIINFENSKIAKIIKKIKAKGK
jgi:hypothetical protein